MEGGGREEGRSEIEGGTKVKWERHRGKSNDLALTPEASMYTLGMTTIVKIHKQTVILCTLCPTYTEEHFQIDDDACITIYK